MPDVENAGSSDDELISTTEEHEIEYWTGELGVSREQLAEALKAVGNSAQAVSVQVKHIGNTRVQGHGLQFQGQVVLLLFEVSFIKSPQAYRSEVHVPQAITHRFNSDVLARQKIAHVDAPGVPVDEAAVADAMRMHVARVDHLGQALGIGPRRRDVEARWCSLRERLMRAFGVVVTAEQVKASLLGARVGRGRLRGSALKGAVHALVTPILLRLSGFDAFGDDPQANPPDRKAREPGASEARKGNPVIGASADRR